VLFDSLFADGSSQLVQIILTLGITATVLIFWVGEWLPLDVVAIAAAAALLRILI
jgi:hypothetical protein